ncbi:MAG: histidine--tRNA ligase [Pseudomonadota bacterium]
MGKAKTIKPKARRPRGFRDRSGAELARERQAIDAVRAVYESYGFDPLETPSFEYANALGKFLPDDDRPNQGVFSLQDDDEQWISLRYDLTAPLARYVAENYDALPKPFRRYQVGTVWRNEKPGPGRFREFTQFDADCVGAPGAGADAEMCAMMADVVEAAGVARGQYVVRINSRRVLNGVLEAAGLAGEAAVAQRLTVLRAMDKLDRLGAGGVRQLLGEGRKDESGDYTEGAKLSSDQIDVAMAAMEARAETPAATCAALRDVVGSSEDGLKGAAELEEIAAVLDALGKLDGRAVIDPSVVRGLEYYDGPVFEAELLAEILDDKGRPQQFGSVASGGRYDGLVKRFKGVEVPATGMSIGLSRLLAALAAQRGGAGEATGPVVVLVMDKARIADYQRMAAELRASGVRAEVYAGGSGVRAQMKYADKRRAPIAVIEGEDERARGVVQLKDLALGAEMAKAIDDNKTWREDQPAQTSVSRAGLVEGVRAILARRGDER